jgi:hypothetical protein
MRATACGLERGAYVSVARNGQRRAFGTFVAIKDTSRGPFAEYRDLRTGCVHLAPLACVRIARGDERRRKAFAK